jgi:hypothetical protein
MTEMLKTPRNRGVALMLAAALAVLGLTLLSTKAISAPVTGPVLTKTAPAIEATKARDDDDDQDDDRRDPEILRFSTVGDSRQDPVSPDPSQLPVSPQDKHWLENTKAFTRILDTIHEQKAQLFVFNGDMIMGYGNAIVPAKTATVTDIVGSDLVNFYIQYAFWRGMVSRTMVNGIYVVPVAGNHEVQWKAGGKKAQVANENAWRANMGDLILDDARFMDLYGETPTSENVGNNGPVDGLSSDQSQLSYSFDFRGIHFVVINTDPVGADSHAPSKWLATDLAAAKARGVIRSFVFGHKPAFTYYYGAPPTAPLPASPSGLDIDVPARDAFWEVIEAYDATYICGHEHIFHLMQPTAATGGHSWQILVGSGGSPFEAPPTVTTVNPQTDRDYAWATIKVYKSGKVKLTAYGFDDLYGPTHVLQKVTIH